jgi:hypothetical protein
LLRIESGLMGTTDNLTKFLAAWGAILSTFGMGWTFYRDLNDRARLKIGAHIRRLVQSPDGKWYAIQPDLPVEGASEQLFVIVDVTNVGRRPVKWTGWGGDYKKPVDGKSSFSVVPVSLPQMLDEGASHSERCSGLNPAGENVKRLFIWDATGKNWYLPRRVLRNLKEELRKFQNQS